MTGRCCPTCGQALPTGTVPIEALLDIRAEGTMLKIIEELIRAYPRRVSIANIVDALYGDDPNGGPDDPRAVIRVLISRLRPILAGYGWTIPKNTSGFGAHSHYRLERLP